jgi:5-methylcytosine-specific restriction endonuclease McrA
MTSQQPHRKRPRRRKRNGKRQRRLREIRLKRLADNPACFYCGWPLDVESSTLDHGIPEAAGGTDCESNLFLACRRCNRRKADRPLSEVTIHPRRGEGAINPHRIPATRD